MWNCIKLNVQSLSIFSFFKKSCFQSSSIDIKQNWLQFSTICWKIVPRASPGYEVRGLKDHVWRFVIVSTVWRNRNTTHGKDTHMTGKSGPGMIGWCYLLSVSWLPANFSGIKVNFFARKRNLAIVPSNEKGFVLAGLSCRRKRAIKLRWKGIGCSGEESVFFAWEPSRWKEGYSNCNWDTNMRWIVCMRLGLGVVLEGKAMESVMKHRMR